MFRASTLTAGAALASCFVIGCHSGQTGRLGEWIDVGGVAIRYSPKLVDSLELIGVDFNNRTDSGFPVEPVQCVAWYDPGGRHDCANPQRGSIAVRPHAEFRGGDLYFINPHPQAGAKLRKVRLTYELTTHKRVTVTAERM